MLLEQPFPWIAPPYGLLSSAYEPVAPEALPDRWMQGYHFRPHPASSALGFIRPGIECPPVPIPAGARPVDAQLDTIDGEPYTIGYGTVCDTRRGLASIEQQATSTFNAVKSTLLESAFVINPDAAGVGVGLNAPYLSAPTTPILGGGTPVSSARALQMITQHLARQGGGGLGMVHITPAVFIALLALGLVTKQGNRMVTARGDVVVVGSGYPGFGPRPDVATPPLDPGNVSHHYIYGSGPVVVHQVDAPFLDGDTMRNVDRATNTVEVRVSQDIAVIADPALFCAVCVETASL